MIEGLQVDNELDHNMCQYREIEMKSIVKKARKLRESATDVTEALTTIEGYLATLKKMTDEVMCAKTILLDSYLHQTCNVVVVK